MGRVRFVATELAATVAFLLWTLLGAASPVLAQVQTAVEYGYRSIWDYGDSSYFVT